MISSNDTINFGITLSAQPEVSTNCLKATIGVIELLQDRPWAPISFIPEHRYEPPPVLALKPYLLACANGTLFNGSAPAKLGLPGSSPRQGAGAST